MAGMVLLLYNGPTTGEDRGGETDEFYVVTEVVFKDLDWKVG